jgi:hypothetical protein
MTNASDILKETNNEELFSKNLLVSISGVAMVNARPVKVARNKEARITSIKLKTAGFISQAIGADK